MVALGRKYDTGIFLSPTKETCFLYLYTCYFDEDYVPRYARNFVLYYVVSARSYGQAAIVLTQIRSNSGGRISVNNHLKCYS